MSRITARSWLAALIVAIEMADLPTSMAGDEISGSDGISVMNRIWQTFLVDKRFGQRGAEQSTTLSMPLAGANMGLQAKAMAGRSIERDRALWFHYRLG